MNRMADVRLELGPLGGPQHDLLRLLMEAALRGVRVDLEVVAVTNDPATGRWTATARATLIERADG